IRRAEAVIRFAGLQQLQCCPAMPIESFRLEKRTLVPIQFEPGQRLKNALGHFVARPFDIGVLNAQNENAVVFTCEQPVEKGGSGCSHVQISGGRWSNANANLFRHYLPLSFRRAATASRSTSILGSDVSG